MGKRSVKHFRVYGGPEGRSIARVRPGVTELVVARSAIGCYTQFRYVLVSCADGSQAFVPKDDADLIEAYLYSPAASGDMETETLAIEIDRRRVDSMGFPARKPGG